MRAIHLLLASAVIISGCSKSVDAVPENPSDTSARIDGTYAYRAGFEEIDTKVYVDDALHLFWTADDRLSVFEKKTYNRQLVFLGETGANSGDFNYVGSPSPYSSESPLTSNIAIYSVYPYKSNTTIAYDGRITFSLPDVQHYASNSFGLGDNPMVSVTEEGEFLSFKSIGAFLVFNLYGEGASIKSITLSSQAGEPLAGRVVITASRSADPSMVFAEGEDGSRTSTLTLDCGEGVELGATAAEAKTFWFVIPAGILSNGFAVTFTSTDNTTITRTASGSRNYIRNKVHRVPALELKFSNPPMSYAGISVEGFEELDFEW